MSDSKMNVLPIELVKEALSYDPDTGLLTWKVNPNAPKTFNKRLFGTPALSFVHRSGYLTGHLFGSMMRAHRVAWALHFGAWPDQMIDHINGDRSDNRIENLRLATKSQNSKNRKPKENGSSSYLGVSYHKLNKRFAANIVENGKKNHLGYFDDERRAAAAYDAAAIRAHGEFANPNLAS